MDVMFLVCGYIGGSCSEKMIRKTSGLNCCHNNSGIQREVHKRWLERVPDLAKVGLVILVHCELDEMASHTDMVLFANIIKEA